MSLKSVGVCSSVRPSTVSITDTGYSVKKTRQIIDKLEKENFSLKLKLHLMEKRQHPETARATADFVDEDGVADLVLQNQAMHNELEEKHDLLRSALEAIGLLEHQIVITEKQCRAMLIAQQKRVSKASKVRSMLINSE